MMPVKPLAKRRRMRLVLLCCFLILIAVVGTVVAVLQMQESSPGEEQIIDTSSNETTSNVTSSAPTALFSISPSYGPTPSPTELQLYDAPTEEECLAVSNGLPSSLPDELIERNFELDMDVTLEASRTEMTDDLELELAEKIQEYLVQALAGCPDEALNM
mmetsp:Transcript_30832/g.74073  ORF Transcript_30832/g.74073 Transcript_30832/m.74073 type:complete len:160 (+) Transcript_30832:454-933(+)